MAILFYLWGSLTLQSEEPLLHLSNRDCSRRLVGLVGKKNVFIVAVVNVGLSVGSHTHPAVPHHHRRTRYRVNP